MIGYIYNIDTSNVHVRLISDDQAKIESAAKMLCDDDHALTYTPAFGTNDGLSMGGDANEYDLDDDALDLQDMSL